MFQDQGLQFKDQVIVKLVELIAVIEPVCHLLELSNIATILLVSVKAQKVLTLV
jgi:hypothetical protein